MVYKKQDALMTRGMAILCMVILHLFCRKGADIFGTPLVWINNVTPLVYWFGFYCEICVSIYSICVGYAQYMLYLNGRASIKQTFNRILKLMINYWIILVMFSLAGLIYKKQGIIPGSAVSFIKSVVLLHSYNGAWWYLNTYVLFLLIPPFLKYFPVEKLSLVKGCVFCVAFQVSWYLINKSGIWPVVPTSQPILSFILKEVSNLLGILPSVWMGAFFYKGDLLPKIENAFFSRFSNEYLAKPVLGAIWIAVFILMNVIHKAVLTFGFAIATFILFNIWRKGELTKKIFIFLGKHSTNIWLSHMFFYTTLFEGLVQSVMYPIFMLMFMLVLTITTSYLEMAIARMLEVIISKSHRRIGLNS